MSREYFPAVDAGSFEMYVRPPSGLAASKSPRIASPKSKTSSRT